MTLHMSNRYGQVAEVAGYLQRRSADAVATRAYLEEGYPRAARQLAGAAQGLPTDPPSSLRADRWRWHRTNPA